MRFLTATGGFLLTLAGFFFYTETGGGRSGISGIIRKISVVLLPLLLLGWGAIHLNDGLRASLPVALPRWLTIVTFVAGSIPVITFYAGSKSMLGIFCWRQKRGLFSSVFAFLKEHSRGYVTEKR